MTLADLIAEKQSPSKRKVSFKNIIDSYLLRRDSFQPFHAQIQRSSLVGFHPSALHDACARQIAFQFLYDRGILKDAFAQEAKEAVEWKSAKTELIFDFGHLIHFLIQYGYLPHIYKNVRTEVAITSLMKKYWISGTTDVVIVLQDGKEYVVDIKTIRSEAFYKLVTKGDVPEHYVTQLNLYMFGLNIPRGLIFYVNKNDCETKEFFFDLDKGIVDDVLSTTKRAQSMLKGSVFPGILHECHKKTGLYKKCPFTSMCFQVQESRAKLANFCKDKQYEALSDTKRTATR